MPEPTSRSAWSWLVSACIFSVVCWSQFALFPAHREVLGQPVAWLLALAAVVFGVVIARRNLRDSAPSRGQTAAWALPLATALGLSLGNSINGDEPLWPYGLLVLPLSWLSQAVTQVMLIKRQAPND